MDTPALKPTSYLEKIMYQAEADLVAGSDITTVKSKAELDKLFEEE